MVLKVGQREVFYDPTKDFDMPKVSFFKILIRFFQRAKLMQTGNNNNKTQKAMYLKRKEDQWVQQNPSK